MPYLILSIIQLFKKRHGHNLCFVLYCILFFSSISAYLVGRQPDILEIDILIFTLYICFLLYLLYKGFEGYGNVRELSLEGLSKVNLKKFERFTIIVSCTIFIIYIYLLCHSLSMLLVQSVTVNEFKNDEDGASQLFDSLFPHIVTTFTNFFNPLAFFNIAFHFYYLIKGQFKKSVIFFLLSLLLPLSGFISLSRAASVQFFLLYFAIYYFVYPIISYKVRRIFNKIIIIVTISVVVVFGLITFNRFSEFYTKESQQTSIIDESSNPVLFSICDYFSQWEENGPAILKLYKPEYKSYGLFNSSGLALQIKRRITGRDEVSLLNEMTEKRLGRLWMMFHGLIARLVYDFGFIGSIIFVLIYSRIVKAFRPKSGVLNFKTLLAIAVLLPMPLMSFQGNALAGLAIDLAIIYLFFILKYIKSRPVGKLPSGANNTTKFANA